MSEIEPGDGWRSLGPDEPIKAGDEFWRDAIPLFKHEAGWIPTISGFIGLVAHGFKVRRRIPAKPEWFTGPNISTYESGPFWLMETYEEKTLLDPNEAREFAAWLVRYADWREAQGEAK